MDVDGEVEVETDRATPPPSTARVATTSTVRVILPTSFQFSISAGDVDRLLEMRRRCYQRESERKLSKLGLPILTDNGDQLQTTSSSTGKAIQHRDMEWLTIVLPFIRKYNPHCGVCASSKNYGKRLDTPKGYLLRAYFYCQGRDCPFHCVVTIKDDGRGLLCSRSPQGNIVDHRNAKRVARPNRAFNAAKTKPQNDRHGSPTRRQAKSASTNEPQWNQPATTVLATSRFDTDDFDLGVADFDDSFQMSSSARFTHMCCNLAQLATNLRDEIEPTSLLPGGLQHVSLKPFFIAVHTENAVRYYHSMLTKKPPEKPSTPIHIRPAMTIQQNQSIGTASQILLLNTDVVYHTFRANSSGTSEASPHHLAYMIVGSVEHDDKKLLYYELMLSNSDDTSFVPITLAYTEDNDDSTAQNYALKSWLERFRFDHEYLYKSSLPSLSKDYSFPQPLLLLVDDHRETPLNNATLQFFNNETFKEYIMRTYLLVSSKIDYPAQQESTARIVLHVSSSIVLADFRTYVNKYVPNELRQLALWSSLLLLCTSTWREMRQTWSLICEIFLNWGTNFVSLKAYEDLCARVSKIEKDPDVAHCMELIHSSATDQQPQVDDDDNDLDEPPESIIDLSDFQNDHFYTKNMITNEASRYVSPYENDLRRIFNEKNKSKTTLVSSWESLSISDRSTLKKIKGNWKWLHLLLKDYIPTIPLWSNLIHSVPTSVKHVRLNKRLAALMMSKDKRINQIKRIQLAERVHGKTDLVIGSLAKDLHAQVATADGKHSGKQPN